MRSVPAPARSGLAAGGPLTALPPFAGYVLIGGASSRMGTDKAAIEVDGRSLVRVSIDALADGDSTGVIGHSDSVTVGLEPVPDAVPGRGPLGGIATALSLSDQSVTVVISCDLPRIERAAVRALVANLGDADLAVPLVAGRPQWTVGAWRTAAVTAVEQQLQQGERRIRNLSRRLRVAYLLGGDDRYRDVDTPEDLALLD